MSDLQTHQGHSFSIACSCSSIFCRSISSCSFFGQSAPSCSASGIASICMSYSPMSHPQIFLLCQQIIFQRICQHHQKTQCRYITLILYQFSCRCLFEPFDQLLYVIFERAERGDRLTIITTGAAPPVTGVWFDQVAVSAQCLLVVPFCIGLFFFCIIIGSFGIRASRSAATRLMTDFR